MAPIAMTHTSVRIINHTHVDFEITHPFHRQSRAGFAASCGKRKSLRHRLKSGAATNLPRPSSHCHQPLELVDGVRLDLAHALGGNSIFIGEFVQRGLVVGHPAPL